MVDVSKLTGDALKRYNSKMDVLHKGPCSSPYANNCPCTNDCPLHGRCCDCVHMHIKNCKEAGTPVDVNRVLVACQKLTYQGEFDKVHVHSNQKEAEKA